MSDQKNQKAAVAEETPQAVEASKNEVKIRKPRAKQKVVPASEANGEIGEDALKLKLQLPLPVYGKKSLENFARNMPQGSEVIIKKTNTLDEKGSPVIRVKKVGSTRTFYTTKESAEALLS